MVFGARSQTPTVSSPAEQALKKNLVKQKPSVKAKVQASNAEGTASIPRVPIPPPPPPPSRAEHLRPASPALVRSTGPSNVAGRPSTSSLIHGFPVNRHPTTFVMGKPWGTPPVDRLMCALDARDLGTPEIIRRLKAQFPTLSPCVITSKMVSTRLQLLDQRVDIDYFKYGIGLGSRSIEDGVGFTRGARHGAAIHDVASPVKRGKSPMNTVRPKISTNSLTAKPSQASLKHSRGALHGLAIQEEVSEGPEPSKEQAHAGGISGPISSSASTSLQGGANHGRLIHHEHKPCVVGGISAPFSSTAGSSVRGGSIDGPDHGKVIHHRREFSEISGTTVALDGDPSTTLSIKRPVEKVKLLKTKFDFEPVQGDDDTQNSTVSDMPSISVTPPLSNVTNTRAASRAAKLGLAIHTNAIRNQPAKSDVKLHVTNDVNKENPTSIPVRTGSLTVADLPVCSSPMKSTPYEYRRKRDAKAIVANEKVFLENSNRSPGGLGNAFQDASPLEIKRKIVSKAGDDKEKRRWVRESVEMKPLNPTTPKFSAESWVREEILSGGLRDERIK